MNYTNVTNPIWSNAEHNAIDCEVTFETIGTVPFTADPLDTSNPSSKQIFDECVAGDYGPVADWLFWTDCPDECDSTYWYYNIEKQIVEIKPPIIPTAEENKNTAVNLLEQTDWTTIPDVADPALSNPYLTNQLEFIEFRNQVRPIAINPVAGNIYFPQVPIATWSS